MKIGVSSYVRASYTQFEPVLISNQSKTCYQLDTYHEA